MTALLKPLNNCCVAAIEECASLLDREAAQWRTWIAATEERLAQFVPGSADHALFETQLRQQQSYLSLTLGYAEKVRGLAR